LEEEMRKGGGGEKKKGERGKAGKRRGVGEEDGG
jgi:hypothetical protein